MNAENFKILSDYISEWNKSEDKPSNEKVFIDEFIKLLDNFPDEREVEFDGDGSYFGKQVTLLPFSYYGKPDRNLSFEVAYRQDQIRVYTAHHHGFWNPEYINIHAADEDFNRLKESLYNMLKNVFGL